MQFDEVEDRSKVLLERAIEARGTHFVVLNHKD